MTITTICGLIENTSHGTVAHDIIFQKRQSRNPLFANDGWVVVILSLIRPTNMTTNRDIGRITSTTGKGRPFSIIQTTLSSTRSRGSLSSRMVCWDSFDASSEGRVTDISSRKA